ncbi:MAG: hypothetical protein QE269_01515 [Fimbriimonas sp.]|nr:hypothetical protein [Fimbriimonas sp.]
MNTVHLVNPKEVERFLLDQEGIIDASAWFDNGVLTAQVTFLEGTPVTERALIALCKLGLGNEKAPSQVMINIAKPRAFVRVA